MNAGSLASEPWFVTTDHSAYGRRVCDRVLTGGEVQARAILSSDPCDPDPWRDHQRKLEKPGGQKEPLEQKEDFLCPLVDTASYILLFICSINIYFTPAMF